MTSRAAATRYARALFDVALQEHHDLELVDQHLGEFATLLAQHPSLARVLLNPAVPVPRKKAAVVELTNRLGLIPVVAKLLALLAERDRLGLLPGLQASYRDRLLDHQHVVRAEVTTASPLPPERARDIEHRLAAVTGKRVTLAARVDPAIIGGVVTRVGSTVYDGSVTRQLEKIRSRLTGER